MEMLRGRHPCPQPVNGKLGSADVGWKGAVEIDVAQATKLACTVWVGLC